MTVAATRLRGTGGRCARLSRVRDPPTHPDRAPTLAEMVRAQTGMAWSRARRLCEEGRVLVDGVRCTDPATRLAPGAAVAVDERAQRLRTGPLVATAIVYVDRDVVVLDKPPGMLSVADTPGNKATLADYARTLLRQSGAGGVDVKLGVVHRLDRETSGLMAFARTAHAQRALAAQFRAHTVERLYHAIVHGAVAAQRIESSLVLDRGDGLRGSHERRAHAARETPREARRAVTHLRPLVALTGATLVECRLETGRQHQIRIHLAELGHPLLGERVYIRDHRGPVIEAPRTMLHARTLGFLHPRTGRPVTYEREPPEDDTERENSRNH